MRPQPSRMVAVALALSVCCVCCGGANSLWRKRYDCFFSALNCSMSRGHVVKAAYAPADFRYTAAYRGKRRYGNDGERLRVRKIVYGLFKIVRTGDPRTVRLQRVQ